MVRLAPCGKPWLMTVNGNPSRPRGAPNLQAGGRLFESGTAHFIKRLLFGPCDAQALVYGVISRFFIGPVQMSLSKQPAPSAKRDCLLDLQERPKPARRRRETSFAPSARCNRYDGHDTGVRLRPPRSGNPGHM